MSEDLPFDSTLAAPATPVYVTAAPAAAPANGLGTAGMILGIVGACLMWVPVLGFILGVLATIFGGIGLSKSLRGTATNKGMAITGLALGIITVAFFPLVFGAVVASVPVTP